MGNLVGAECGACERPSCASRDTMTLDGSGELDSVAPADVRANGVGNRQNYSLGDGLSASFRKGAASTASAAETGGDLQAELAAMDLITVVASKGGEVVNPSTKAIGLSVAAMQKHVEGGPHEGFYHWLMKDDMHALTNKFETGPGLWLERAVLIKALSEYTKETGGASREGSDGWWVGKSSSKSELVEVPAGGKAAAAPAPVARGLTEPPTVGVTADSLDTKDHSFASNDFDGKHPGKVIDGQDEGPAGDGEKEAVKARDQSVKNIVDCACATKRAAMLATMSAEDRSAALMAMSRGARRETIEAMPPGLLMQILSPRK